MSKLSVFLYITIAIGVLLLVSYAPPNPHSSSTYDDPHHPNNNHHRSIHRGGARRLKLRTNFTLPTSKDAIEHYHSNPHHHDPIPFDPLVADIERHREDREWERHYFEDHHKEFADAAHRADHDAATVHGHSGEPEWEDFQDAEEYLNDEERFNVTNRLILLFPKIDVDPQDGFVSEKELVDWTVEQSVKEVLHRSQREMEIHDKNRDGFVSFQEYEPPNWAKDSDTHQFGYNMGWWKEEHFNASDMNGDGLLNITEFNDFLHPADTKNPKLLKWLCQEEIRERDTDKDGKVNFKEFFHGLFDLVRNYDEEDHNSTHIEQTSEAPAKKLFSELDKDGDGFLSDEELLPIIAKLHPSEHYYAKQQADYIISQADTDKDGRLSLHEMLENPYAFYSSIFSDEDDYDEHDELR